MRRRSAEWGVPRGQSLLHRAGKVNRADEAGFGKVMRTIDEPRFRGGSTAHVRVDAVAEDGVAALVAQPLQSLFDDGGAGAAGRRGLLDAPRLFRPSRSLAPHCTAMVTVLEVAPPMLRITGTAPPAGAPAGTWTFT